MFHKTCFRSTIVAWPNFASIATPWLPNGQYAKTTLVPLIGSCVFFACTISPGSEVIFDTLNNPSPASLFVDRDDLIIAQEFVLPDDLNHVSSVTLSLARDGRPRGDVMLEIWNSDPQEGLPDEPIASVAVIDQAFDLPSLDFFGGVPFDTRIETSISGLDGGIPYYLVMSANDRHVDPFNTIHWEIVSSEVGAGDSNRAISMSASSDAWEIIAEKYQFPVNYMSMAIEADRDSLIGDFNQDGILSAMDLDMLSFAIKSGDDPPEFDVDGNQRVTSDDHKYWVTELRKTHFGDSNLDGEFNSSDLVAIFEAGKYEITKPADAGWSEGDWNGDGLFDSGDLVVAFEAGGYETGPQVAQSVPEPSCLTLCCLTCMTFTADFRKRKSAGAK